MGGQCLWLSRAKCSEFYCGGETGKRLKPPVILADTDTRQQGEYQTPTKERRQRLVFESVTIKYNTLPISHKEQQIIILWWLPFSLTEHPHWLKYVWLKASPLQLQICLSWQLFQAFPQKTAAWSWRWPHEREPKQLFRPKKEKRKTGLNGPRHVTAVLASLHRLPVWIEFKILIDHF